MKGKVNLCFRDSILLILKFSDIISSEITQPDPWEKRGRLHDLNHGIVCLSGVYMPGGNHAPKKTQTHVIILMTHPK